jgi:hypothetical protein
MLKNKLPDSRSLTVTELDSGSNSITQFDDLNKRNHELYERFSSLLNVGSMLNSFK